MQHFTRLSIDAQAVIQAQGTGGLSSGGITDFLTSQVIFPLLLLSAIIVIYLFMTQKQKAALGIVAGVLVGLGFLGLINNWEALTTWIAGLVS